jgi:hypothetical protein
MTQKGIAMERRRGLETRRLVTIVIFFCALAIPLFAVAGCDKQLARMEGNQIRLQAMVAANARELATISSQLDTGQGKINESIRTLDGDTQQVAANVASRRDEQRQFRDADHRDGKGLNRRIGYVETTSNEPLPASASCNKPIRNWLVTSPPGTTRCMRPSRIATNN